MTRIPRILPASLLAAATLLAGCGNSGESATSTTAARSSSTTAAGAATTTAAAGSTGSGAGTTASAAAASTIEQAVTATNAFLSSLDSSARSSAVFSYTDVRGKQGTWSNLPTGIFRQRQGAKLGDLSADQRAKALAAVESLLSEQGREQIEGILAADDYLGTNAGAQNSRMGWSASNYYLAVYGEPSVSSPWTLQFGGHHLAVHITVGGGTISASPIFTGVEPTRFTANGKEYAPMVAEADAVFGLLGSLSSEQKSAAKLNGTFDNIVVGPGADSNFPTQEGMPVSKLTEAQTTQLTALIKLWVGDAAGPLSDALLETYRSELDQTTISWAGSTDRSAAGSYLRIDGPRLWIEYLNAPGIGTSEVHYHTIYRDKQLDYGNGAQ